MTKVPSQNIRFRPRFWAIALFVPMFTVLIGLGAWQVLRYDWKTEIIAYREARLLVPAVALSDDAGGDEFRRVIVEGEFFHDKEMFLAANHGGRFGFHVITPLKRSNGSFVLIDRGWIPPDMRLPSLREESRIEGGVTIEGIIRSNPGRSWLSPENDPAKNYWFWRDFQGMAKFSGIDAPPYMIEAGPSATGGLPVGREFRVELRNEHLQYVIIWFSLAIALAVIFFLSQRVAVEPPTQRENAD